MSLPGDSSEDEFSGINRRPLILEDFSNDGREKEQASKGVDNY